MDKALFWKACDARSFAAISGIRNCSPIRCGTRTRSFIWLPIQVIPSVEKPQFNFDVNVIGSFNVLEAARASGIKRVVSASTGGAIIGEVTPPVHEAMVPHPMSPYGASKLAVEGYCSAFSASYGLNAISLRFSNVYGPRSFHKGSVVAEFLRGILHGRPLTIYGDGSQTRDYVFVEDLCEGILAGLTRDVSGVFSSAPVNPLA